MWDIFFFLHKKHILWRRNMSPYEDIQYTPRIAVIVDHPQAYDIELQRVDT